MSVDRFVAFARPAAREIMIVFEQGYVSIAEAEARQLIATIGGALQILDGEHPAQQAPAPLHVPV